MRSSILVLLLLNLTGCGSDGGGQLSAQATAGLQVIAPREGGLVNRARPTVRWTAHEAAHVYQVEVFRDRAATDLVGRGEPTEQTSYQLPFELLDDRDYYFRIVALTPIGWSFVRSPVVHSRTRLVPDWTPEFELVTHDVAGVEDGYRLTNLMNVTPKVPGEAHGALLLFNRWGEIVWFHEQEGKFGAIAGQNLTEDRTILYIFRPLGKRGVAYEIDLEGNVYWQSREGRWLHHDVGTGPGGNRMYLEWLFEEHDGVLYEGDGIELVDPATNEVLWSWNIFDHFDPAETPGDEPAKEGLSRNGALDWSHSNAVIWDEERSLLWVSSRDLDRLIGIDYPSGAVVATLGAGGIGGAGIMSHQHGPELQPDGSILIWDNGNGRTPRYSRAIQYGFDIEAGTYETLFEWHAMPQFFDVAVGDADRLPNGNTLITAGASGRIIEVDPTGRIVWDLRMPERSGFWHYRCQRVPEDWISEALRAPAD